MATLKQNSQALRAITDKLKSLPKRPVLTEVTLMPSKDDVIAVPDEGEAFSKVTVNGDANLIAENIAEGVSIFGVTGTHRGGSVFTGSATLSEDGILTFTYEGWEEYENAWHLYDNEGNLIAEETATYFQSVDLSEYMEIGVTYRAVIVLYQHNGSSITLESNPITYGASGRIYLCSNLEIPGGYDSGTVLEPEPTEGVMYHCVYNEGTVDEIDLGESEAIWIQDGEDYGWVELDFFHEQVAVFFRGSGDGWYFDPDKNITNGMISVYQE